MEPNSGMTKDERAVIGGALAKLLADTYVLYLLTQNFHWNVHGPLFYCFHKLSETQYEEMATAIDEIAERVRALGFFVEGSMHSFLKISSIKEEEEIHPTHKSIENLIIAHESVIREAKVLAKMADKHGDAATVDLMGRRLNVHEKAVWMLRASL